MIDLHRLNAPFAGLWVLGNDVGRELAAMEQVDERTAQAKILDILRKAAAVHNKDKEAVA